MQGQNVTLRDLAESVLAFEPLCTESCARREDRHTTVIPELEKNIADAENSLGNGERFTDIGRSFHDILVDWSTNETTRVVVRSLVAVWSIQEKSWAENLQSAGEYPGEHGQRDALEAHRRITRLIARGHAARAAEMMATHVEATQQLVLSTHGDHLVDVSSPFAIQEFKNL